MTLASWNDWQTHYQTVLALPDWQVRRARLEVLDQTLVDACWQEGRLLARPKVVVEFEEGPPQGQKRAGARAEAPGLIRMRSDQWGRVASGTGCAATGAQDPHADIGHRWAVLFHEAAHFTFDQLSSKELTAPLSSQVSPALTEGLNHHLWAPFLNNLERRRLDETFADAWSSAVLLEWGGSLARAEVDRLRQTRQVGRLTSEQAWQEGHPDQAHSRIHVGDQALDRVLQISHWDQWRGRSFLDQVLIQTLNGTVDRWRTQGSQALAAIEDSWVQVDVSRLRVAALHARHHHDPVLLNRWIESHPDHPMIQLAQGLRWTAPPPQSPAIKAWAASWEDLSSRDLAPIGQALADLWNELGTLCGPTHVRRRLRPS